jgi:hypothetical protein
MTMYVHITNGRVVDVRTWLVRRTNFMQTEEIETMKSSSVVNSFDHQRE